MSSSGVLFQGGSGYVRGIRFQNIRMDDVENPIIIDQFYCDSPKTCENQVRSLKAFPFPTFSVNELN